MFALTKIRSFARWVATATFTVCLASTGGQVANAGMLHNGWNYAIDSFTDGFTGNQVGGGVFEFYGMAIQEKSDRIVVALNANLPLEGFAHSEAAKGSVGWGDLFFNFSGQNFNTASANGSLFAVRFAETNDSGAATTGVYKNVTAKSVSLTNSGFVNLAQYDNYVATGGGTSSMADLAATDPYFEREGYATVLNEIESGNKVGDISFLNLSDLNTLGLNFDKFGASGSETFGFSFAKSALPTDSYIANIFAECANDGIAIISQAESVPEPGSALGILAFGAFGGVSRLLRKKVSS